MYKFEKFKFGMNARTLFLIYFVLIFVAALTREAYDAYIAYRTANSPQIVTEEVQKVVETPRQKNIPSSHLIPNFPYTVQAPYGNWNIHEESCEEAGLLMSHYYYLETSFPENVIPKDKADSELTAMVDWQKKNYGVEADLDMTALGKLYKEYYGHNYEVKKGITEKEIKEAISSGFPVIVPVMTKSLNNPNYGAQTTYHVVLLVGYDESGVIANDSGVRQGQGYKYTWDTIWGAIDAQTPKMSQGRDMLILKN